MGSSHFLLPNPSCHVKSCLGKTFTPVGYKVGRFLACFVERQWKRSFLEGQIVDYLVNEKQLSIEYWHNTLEDSVQGTGQDDYEKDEVVVHNCFQVLCSLATENIVLSKNHQLVEVSLWKTNINFFPSRFQYSKNPTWIPDLKIQESFIGRMNE